MELIAPIFVTFGGIVWVVYSLMNYALWERGGPGSGLFPVISGGIAALTGVYIIIKTVKRMKEKKDIAENADPETAAEEGSKAMKPDTMKVVLPILGMVFIVVMIHLVGLVLSLAVFLLIWLRFVEKESWLKSILVAILCPVALYLIFHVALSIRFPTGLLGWF